MKNQRNSSNLVDVKRGITLFSYQQMTVSITQADDLLYISYTLDLVIFARFYFLRISREGQIREFKNIAKIVNIIALLKKNEDSQILNFAKRPKIGNSRKFKHAKLPDLQYVIFLAYGYSS